MSTQSVNEPYSSIIQQALTKRGHDADDFSRHPQYSAPNYVVRMCTSLTEAVHKAGNQAVTLEQLIRLESTCTGTDYQHKLHCAAIAWRKESAAEGYCKGLLLAHLAYHQHGAPSQGAPA